jgi:hypothetical protein
MKFNREKFENELYKDFFDNHLGDIINESHNAKIPESFGKDENGDYCAELMAINSTIRLIGLAAEKLYSQFQDEVDKKHK